MNAGNKKINKSILIGIAGGSGSGKTLVAQTLLKDMGSDKVVFIQQDSYYKDRSHLSFKEREKLTLIILMPLIF